MRNIYICFENGHPVVNMYDSYKFVLNVKRIAVIAYKQPLDFAFIFRKLIYFQAFDFVLDTIDNILDTAYGLIGKAQTLDNSANK